MKLKAPITLTCWGFSLLFVTIQAANAAFITGSLDPNFSTTRQGASAATFDALGFTVGTGPTDLKVSLGTFSDPAGLAFGQIHALNPNGGISGTTTNKLNFAFSTTAANAASVNARDYDWLQNIGTNSSTNPALDQPWRGTIWDLGGQANQAVVFPIVDHAPLPQEAIEYTVYLTNTPDSITLSDWTLAILNSVYLEGWEADNISLADGFTTVWKLPGNQTFQFVSVQAIGSQALRPLFGNEDEIDAVAGLTSAGAAVPPTGIPEPSTLAILGLGLAGLSLMRRRRRH